LAVLRRALDRQLLDPNAKLTIGPSRRHLMTEVGQGFRKHEAPSGQAAPFRDSSLQRPQLTVGEITRALTAESCKQFQPLAMSVRTSVEAKLPAMLSPQWTTRSTSTKPGGGSCQSANVRTGTRRRTAGVVLARERRPPANARAPDNMRSIVAALTASRCARTFGSSFT
jgi:hypothetical protein